MTSMGEVGPARPVLPDKSFFSRLFDFSFHSFITPSIISLLFALVLLMSGLYALGFIFILGSMIGGAGYVLGLLLSPVIFLVGALLGRMYLEIGIVFFRIEENTRGH